jgi:hypothetical protein
LGLKTDPGLLCLQGDDVAFTLENGSPVFRAPVKEIRASFPKLMLPLLKYSYIGTKLAVDGTTYRLSFVPVQYSGTRIVKRLWETYEDVGPSWSFGTQEDVERARVSLDQWMAVLGKPANSGH